MKYVIELVQQGNMGALRVHVFSEAISHCDYAKHPEGKAVGAGFCELICNRVVLSSRKSISLKLGPHEADLQTLTCFFGGTFEQQRILLADFYL